MEPDFAVCMRSGQRPWHRLSKVAPGTGRDAATWPQMSLTSLLSQLSTWDCRAGVKLTDQHRAQNDWWWWWQERKLKQKSGSPPFFAFPSPPRPFLLFPSLPFPPLPLEVGPILRLRGLGSAAGPGGARPPNAFWCIFSLLTGLLWRFCDWKKQRKVGFYSESSLLVRHAYCGHTPAQCVQHTLQAFLKSGGFKSRRALRYWKVGRALEPNRSLRLWMIMMMMMMLMIQEALLRPLVVQTCSQWMYYNVM